MLFRNKEGELVIICKSAYKNDILYYKTIIKMLPINAHINANAPINANVVASSSSSSSRQMDNMVNTISQLLYHKR